MGLSVGPAVVVAPVGAGRPAARWCGGVCCELRWDGPGVSVSEGTHFSAGSRAGPKDGADLRGGGQQRSSRWPVWWGVGGRLVWYDGRVADELELPGLVVPKPAARAVAPAAR